MERGATGNMQIEELSLSKLTADSLPVCSVRPTHVHPRMSSFHSLITFTEIVFCLLFNTVCPLCVWGMQDAMLRPAASRAAGQRAVSGGESLVYYEYALVSRAF